MNLLVMAPEPVDAGALRGALGEDLDEARILYIAPALATFPADRVLVFVRDGEEQAYREDDVIGVAERRFGVPVTQARL